MGERWCRLLRPDSLERIKLAREEQFETYELTDAYWTSVVDPLSGRCVQPSIAQSTADLLYTTASMKEPLPPGTPGKLRACPHTPIQ